MPERAKQAGEIDDPKALRALAHPLRWQLLEVLASEGPSTATRCAEILGEPVNSCSFHLRMLAKYGFVEQGSAVDRRSHPWQLSAGSISWDSSGDAAPEADRLNAVLIEREARRQREFLRDKAQLPRSWRRAAYAGGRFRWLTASELTELNRAITVLIDEYAERSDPEQRPREARLVRLLAVNLPVATHRAET